MQRKEVNILMATYNGEKYIETQILSIIWQSFKDWKLIIHDDGSTDDTVKIIKKWSELDNRIVLIEDGKKFKNAAANFMHLLQFAEAPFIMFCDQDDIWFENKISLMLHEIKNKDNSKIQIVYSSSYIWTENNISNEILPVFKPKRLNDFLFLNAGVNGCFAIFNEQTLEIMKQQPIHQAMHDHILQLIGIIYGEISYVPEVLMLYRRHIETVTIAPTKNIFYRITQNNNLPVIDSKHYKAIEDFYYEEKDKIDMEGQYMLNAYLKMPNQSILKNIKDIFKYNFNIDNSKLALIVKLFVRKFYK